MSDLISREDAINALYHHFPSMTMRECENVLHEVPSAEVALCHLDSPCEYQNADIAMPSAQRWIPCSERLPERGEDVLVTRDYNGREDNNKSCRYVEVASCYGEDDDITWNSFSDEYKMHPKNHHVIAWMPLPDPWKGEE